MLAGAATLVAHSQLIRSENANLERRLAAQTIFTSVCALRTTPVARHLTGLDSRVRDFTSCANYRVRPRVVSETEIGMATSPETMGPRLSHDKGIQFLRGSHELSLLKEKRHEEC